MPARACRKRPFPTRGAGGARYLKRRNVPSVPEFSVMTSALSRSFHVLPQERVELTGGSAVLFLARESRHLAPDRRNFPVLFDFVRVPHVFAVDLSLERIRQSLVCPDRTWRGLSVRVLD